MLGANGRFGCAAVRSFSAAGWRVLAQARRPLDERIDGVIHLPIALEDCAELAAYAAGARTVVYAICPPTAQWPRQLLPLARAGMDVAQRLGAVFMTPGNVSNFGKSMPPLLREDTLQRPDTRRGRLRCVLEAEIETCCQQGTRAVILRAGDFFGSGHGTWLDMSIAKSLTKGRLIYPGPRDVPHAWAYLPDLARAFVALASREDLPAFTRLHFTGHTLTGTQLLEGIVRAAAALGIAPARGFKFSTMPWPVIRAGGLLVPLWRQISAMEYLWRVPHALDGSALQALLGEQPATPLDDALAKTLRTLVPVHR